MRYDSPSGAHGKILTSIDSNEFSELAAARRLLLLTISLVQRRALLASLTVQCFSIHVNLNSGLRTKVLVSVGSMP